MCELRVFYIRVESTSINVNKFEIHISSLVHRPVRSKLGSSRQPLDFVYFITHSDDSIGIVTNFHCSGDRRPTPGPICYFFAAFAKLLVFLAFWGFLKLGMFFAVFAFKI
jgi:hypothetical protein